MTSNFKINLKISGTIIEFKNHHKTILNTLETAHKPVDYNCREGFCGACQIELLNGKIHYIKNPLACIPEGMFLPCCSVPSEDIEIKA